MDIDEGINKCYGDEQFYANKKYCEQRHKEAVERNRAKVMQHYEDLRKEF